MKKITARPQESGFTIAEILVAILVGGAMISSLTMIVVSHLHLSQRSRDLVLANAYAEAKVESLRSIGFAGLSYGTSSLTAELPTELKRPKSATLVITAYPPAANPASVKKVDLTLSYNDQGRDQTFSYTTYIGELGVGQY